MRIGEIEIAARRSGAEPVVSADRLRLHAEVEWKVEGPAEQLRAIADALPESVTDLLGPVLLLDFGNAVGRFSVPNLGLVEVVSGKWSEAHFEAMLADIAEEMAALPFAAHESGSLPYDRQLASNPDVLYQAFVYLRHVLSDAAPRHVRLAPALEAVVREPHSRLASTTRTTSLDRATAVDARYLERLAAGAEPTRRAPQHLSGLPLARALRGRVPISVDETRATREVDTAENRFLKTFLGLAEAIVDRVATLADGRSSKRFWRAVREDCRVMRRALVPYTHAPLWAEVGAMRHLPASSTVLQRRRGYREVYRHFLRLRATTRLPLGERQLADLMEVKDIAELYELWCYFAVVHAVSGALSTQPVRVDRFAFAETHVRVPWDFRVEWSCGVCCFYNLRFARRQTAGRQTYSVPLRPDIVLEVPGAGLHVFDAKFKLTALGTWDDEDDDERHGTFKRGDLYKMHTYRDALVAARSVWILYPGTVTRFYACDPARSAHDGVGAIALSPGSTSELGAAIEGLLRVR